MKGNRRKTTAGRGGKDIRKDVIRFRVNAQEKAKIDLLMKNNGYRKVSIFMRDLVLRKVIYSHKEVVKVTDRQLRNQMNDITFQIRKLGENYNQIVARYNAQSKLFQPDGRPYLNTEAVNRTMETLRNITESVRDEVSVAIDLVKRYTQEETIINP